MSDAMTEQLKAQQSELEQMLEKNPKARAFWVQLGKVSKQLGENDKARDAFAKALEMNPNDSFLKNTIAELDGKGYQRPPSKTVSESKLPFPIGATPVPSASDIDPLSPKIIIPAVALIFAILGFIVYRVVDNAKHPDLRILGSTERNLKRPKISPDGLSVAFVSGPPEDNFNGSSIVYISEVEGEESRDVFIEDGELRLENSEGQWLPDSTGLVFMMANKENKRFFVVIDSVGSGKRVVEMQIPPDYSPDPIISPDGRKMAYQKAYSPVGEDRRRVIVAGDLETGEGYEITRFDNIFEMVWTPAGDKIVFCGSFYDQTENKSRNLILLGEPGMEPVVIDDADYSCSPVFFGSTETKLVYMKDQSFWFVPADTFSDPQPFLGEEFDRKIMGEATSTPDLKFLAFVSVIGVVTGPAGNMPTGDIFIFSEDEEYPVKAIDAYQGKFAPSLSPDGKWLAFERFGLRGNMEAFVGPVDPE